MYEGRNKTAICSQRAFSKALVELMKQKDYADITVSELCQQSGISRQTFYALFQTKENILRYEIIQNYAFPEHLTLPPQCSLARYIAHTFAQYIDSNYDFLKLLMAQNLMQVFYQSLVCLIGSREELLRALAPASEQFMMRCISGAACGIINGFMSGDTRRSSQEMEDMIYQLYSGDLFRKNLPPDFTVPSREDK